MCGIVGATSERRVSDILLEGLKRLEYRGYDSAGLAIIDKNQKLQSTRRTGKVQEPAFFNLVVQKTCFKQPPYYA